MRLFLKSLPLILVLTSTAFAQVKNNIAYDNGPFYVVGGYTFDDDKIAELNPSKPYVNAQNQSVETGALTPNRYGTTTILDSATLAPMKDPYTQKDLISKDQHYRVYKYDSSQQNLSTFNSRKTLVGLGMRVIPVANGAYSDLTRAKSLKTGKNSDGVSVKIKGSTLVDEYLRNVVYGYKGQLAKDGPIFAQIAYMHPEASKVPLTGLEEALKFELGITHKGAYLGSGNTRNSPTDYHEKTWWDQSEEHNYPAILHVIDYQGTKSATNGRFRPELFNQNAQITAILLNEFGGGAVFPPDYKFDPVYAVTLEKALDFYKRWIEGDQTIRNDDQYKVYCAEHITMIVNVALNLPQNKKGYQSVYGEVEGAKLWALAVNAWKHLPVASRKIVKGAETSLEDADGNSVVANDYLGLWQLLGHSAPVMKLDGTNNVATAKEFQEVGYSFAWKPETVADLMKDLVADYVRWDLVGPITTVATIIGFESQFQKRMNIAPKDYLSHSADIVSEIFVFHAALTKTAKADSSLDDLRAQYKMGLQMVLKGVDDKQASAVIGKYLEGLTEENVEAAKQKIISKANNSSDFAVLSHASYELFQDSISKNLKEINQLEPVPGAPTVKWYFAPAVHFRVANGFHDSDNPIKKFVNMWPVATILNAEETRPVTATQDHPAISDTVVKYSVYDASAIKIEADPNLPRTQTGSSGKH